MPGANKNAIPRMLTFYFLLITLVLSQPGPVATFSIVAADTAAGELGIAVASRFFTVGNVVPWAKAGVGAVATQSFANTSFGWRGLDLLEQGTAPDEVVAILIRNDDNPTRRQFGVVAADGRSATYTGENCLDWAGGRSGSCYAVQGNILAGEAVVAALEKTFLSTTGTLAERLYAALIAGEAAGGDSRGKQSAALLVVKAGAGYGGYTDRAIDVRVDDHAEPFVELGRILAIARMNYAWNEAWTLFMQKRPQEALPHIERAVGLDPDYPELLYDQAVIRLAAGQPKAALEALEQCLKLNPKLKTQAAVDNDLEQLRADSAFRKLIK
ncbi:MAG: tetratricopeptide repeat protein [Candidatus Neomarinimicrobiota bacterium]